MGSLTSRVALKPRWEWLTLHTIQDVLRIEKESCPRPWGEEEMLAFMRLDATAARVATVDGQVAGFICYELHPTAIEIVHLAVDVRYRRRGVGRYLVDFATRGRCNSRNQAWASVSEINLPACLFLRACGWRAVGLLHGVSGDPGRDLVRFTKAIEVRP